MKGAATHSDADSSHNKELKNFAILNNLKHPNVMELLASYTLGDTHNLLFPLANHGTLSDLLKTQAEIQHFKSAVDFLVAMAGLASAVEHVHNFTVSREIDLNLLGCHHDLRPRNILVHGDRFVLADFGLAQFHEQSDELKTYVNPADDYSAPEERKTPASDIWSFGCILAELIEYMVQGCEGVKRFRVARKFRSPVGSILSQFHVNSEQLNPKVDAWLSQLECQERERPTCALLVWLVRAILQMQHSDRLEAGEITWRLRLLALYEVSEDIDNLFHQVRANADDLDMALEHMRFDSWRDSIQVRDPRNKFKSPGGTSYNAMDQFDAIQGTLSRIHDNLQSRIAREMIPARLDLSHLLRLNADLESFLSEEQNIASQRYFHLKMMEVDNELFDQDDDNGSNSRISADLRLKRTIRNMTHLLEESAGEDALKLLIKPEDVRIQAEEPRPMLHDIGLLTGGLEPRKVWVEWRKYENSAMDKDLTKKLHARTAALATFLSQPKPQSFRTLKCHGYYHKEKQASFGLVFDIPGGARPVKWTTLEREFFKRADSKNEKGSNRLRPDLEDKYKLASSLATAILELHSAGWLHKSLAAENVVFFPQDKQGSMSFVRKPFLVGFNHGRPDDPSTFTTGLSKDSTKLYKHPMYIKNEYRFRQRYDYYSLGMVLLAIGYWRPLDEILEQDGSPEDQRQKCLEKRIPRLAQYVGRGYCEAVRYCIECDFGSSDDLGHETRVKDSLLLFKEQVVDKLDRYLIHP